MTLTDTTSTRTIVAPDYRPTRSRHGAGRLVLGIPYAIFTGALAIIFLYPLVWTTISSFSPQAGSAQTDGWGFGNYVSLANFQAGIWVYLGNSLFVSLLTVVLTLVTSFLGGYAFARF